MRQHASQSIEIGVAADEAFTYIADASTLPEWTTAFASVNGQTALMRTPHGEVEIELTVSAHEAERTIDWFMRFPDGSLADAYSRVIPIGTDRCVYGFILTPPPVPLEALEGALGEQARTLAEELSRLRTMLEDRGR